MPWSKKGWSEGNEVNAATENNGETGVEEAKVKAEKALSEMVTKEQSEKIASERANRIASEGASGLATTEISSKTGEPTVDGVKVPEKANVLLTAQAGT